MKELMLLRDFRNPVREDLQEGSEAVKALSPFSQPPRYPCIKEGIFRSHCENQKH